MKTSSLERAVRLLFFASGFCGLVYEVIWAKTLHKIVGCSLHAVTLVMAAFMSGLALGSLLGARLTRSRANGLRVYAALEAGVGIFALLSPLLFDGLIPVYVGLHRLLDVSPGSAHALRFALCFLALIVPAAMMGATLPVMAHDLDRRTPGLVRNLGHLYGFNTLGATFGCFAAGFLLIPAVGIAWTVRGAALVNLLAATVALRLARRAPDAAPATEPAVAVADDQPNPRVALLLPAFALSGFFAMGYEVLWFKAVAFFISNTATAFSTMLTTFLLGLGLGGVLVGSLAQRFKRLWLGFGVLEILIGGSALVSLVVFAKLSQQGLEHSSGTSLWFKFATSFLVMFLPAVLMGMLLPLAGKLLVRDQAATGAGVGRLYAVNTLGCVAGSALTGLVLIPWWGIQNCILLLCGLQVLLGLVLLMNTPGLPLRRRLAWTVGVAAFVSGLMLVLPVRGSIYSSVKRTGSPGARSIFYREGTAIVEVTESPDGVRDLVINGSLNASPYPVSVGLRAHRLISQLPLMLHPDPRHMLLLGLGSGMTAGAALQFDSLQAIDCAELSRDVALANSYFERWNHGAHQSPKLTIAFEDGRNFMLTATRRYDVITLESIHPKWDAGNASLYSREFYRLCKSRLNPGGFISQWAPLNGMTLQEFKTIIRTFSQEFPHASLWFVQPTGYLASTNAILLGGQEPLSVDPDRFAAAFAIPAVARDLAEQGVDNPIQLLDGFIMEGEALRRFAGQDVPLNTDDHPVLEYGPVVNHHPQVLAALAPVRASVRPLCRPPADESIRQAFFAQLDKQFEVSQLAMRGDLAHLRGDHDQAIGHYGTAFLLDPDSRPVVDEYKNVQFKGNYQFLQTFGQEAGWGPDDIHRFLRIMFHRDDREAVLWTGRQYQRVGWHAAARAQYRQVLDMDPQHAAAAVHLREIAD